MKDKNVFVAIFKEKWKIFLLVGIAVFLVSILVTVYGLKMQFDKKEQSLNVAKVLNFNLETYTNTPSGAANVYDYSAMWKDETLLTLCAGMLDEDGTILSLDSEWNDKTTNEKVQWILDNIEITRLSSSTAYKITFETTVSNADLTLKKKAIGEMLDVFVNYAYEQAQISDVNLEHGEVQEIVNEEISVSKESFKTEVLIYSIISIVVALMVVVILNMGFVILRREKQEK